MRINNLDLKIKKDVITYNHISLIFLSLCHYIKKDVIEAMVGNRNLSSRKTNY